MTDSNSGTHQPDRPPQRSHRGSLLVTFIGGALIGASVFWTGSELLETTAATTDGMTMPAKDGGSHAGHAGMMVAVDEWAAKPTLDTDIYADPVGGWNLNVKTSNFTFDAANAGRDNVEGNGHAHVYVNGMKLGRIYGDWYHIANLPKGRHEISVSLYANDHRGLALGGAKITSTTKVTVE